MLARWYIAARVAIATSVAAPIVVLNYKHKHVSIKSPRNTVCPSNEG